MNRWNEILTELGGFYSETLNLLNYIFVDSGSFWSAVSAIAAALAVWQVGRIQKANHRSLGPYFVIKEPGFKKVGSPSKLRVQITMLNEGGRPAVDFNYRIIIAPERDIQNSIIDLSGSISAPIPVGSPTPWYNDNVRVGTNLPSHFVFLGIKYRDHGSKKQLSQRFIMRWNGVKNGTMEQDFVHTTKAEADSFLEAIPKISKEYPDSL